jgi:hypothetical protein
MSIHAVSRAHETSLAPLGRREAVHRLQGRIQRLWRALVGEEAAVRSPTSSVSVAKYRLHRLQCSQLQGFLAVDTAIGIDCK